MDGVESGTLLDLLGEELRRELTALGRRSAFPKGTRLMHEGEPGNRVMFVLDGHVKTSSTTSHGQEIVLSFCGRGDVLGELSFLDGQSRSSSVTAIEPVDVLIVSGERFKSFLESNPQAAMTLINAVSRRFRDADLKRIQFAASDTTGRVSARLVELAERYGEQVDGEIRIGLPITQEELGSWTSSSRAGVAEALRTMRDLGWIATERRRITVLDLEQLRGRII
jgi:CRP/FNR family cyclic AMP-dependent transcriptional regulator